MGLLNCRFSLRFCVQDGSWSNSANVRTLLESDAKLAEGVLAACKQSKDADKDKDKDKEPTLSERLAALYSELSSAFADPIFATVLALAGLKVCACCVCCSQGAAC